MTRGYHHGLSRDAFGYGSARTNLSGTSNSSTVEVKGRVAIGLGLPSDHNQQIFRRQTVHFGDARLLSGQPSALGVNEKTKATGLPIRPDRDVRRESACWRTRDMFHEVGVTVPSVDLTYTDWMSMLAEMLRDADRIRRLEGRLAGARLASQRVLIERQHLQETIRDLLQRFAVRSRDQPGPSPPELARQLCDAFDATLAGYVHPLLRPTPKRPGQRTWPALRKAQVNALVYIELVRRGVIADRHPVKTVSEMFQVSRRLLRYWRRELQPEALKAIRKVSSEEILYLRATLSNEARRYRRWRGKGEAVPPQDARPALRGMSSSRVLL